MGKNFFVTKASGEKYPFEESKLIHSLKRSGASDDVIGIILNDIQNHLYDGISTKKIYSIAFRLLKKINRPSAARYNLKRAIMALGPSGFPFEKYIAEIFKYQGYNVAVGVIEEGYCVKHEVDIIAVKDGKHLMIECKFHNHPGTFSDVKIPLYINSRFQDIEKKWKEQHGHDNKIHQGWVVTNTRFSEDAIQYGICAGLNLLGWNYPARNNLRELIDTSGLHPITALTSLSSADKERMLADKIILCRDIFNNEALLHKYGMSAERIQKVMRDASTLCNR